MKCEKKLLVCLLCVALMLSSLPVFTLAQESPESNVVSLFEQINKVPGLFAVVDTVDSSVITVLGSARDVSTTLTLDIDAGVTLRWGAFYRGTATGPLINFVGDGTFEVVSGGLLQNVGSGNTILSSGANANITVSGISQEQSGNVEAGSGSAIRMTGVNAVLRVSGHGAVYNSGTTNLQPAINMYNGESSGTNVVVTDFGSVSSVSFDGRGYAIQSYGNVIISGNALVSVYSDTGRAINALGANSVVTISDNARVTADTGITIHTASPGARVIVSGGLVSSEADSDNYPVIDMAMGGTVEVSGGKVQALENGGTAIKISGGAGAVKISGSAQVSATTGRAIYTTSTSSTVEVNGGFVFAYGTAIEGSSNVIQMASNRHPTINVPGIVVAWNKAAYPGPFFVGDTDGLSVLTLGALVEWNKNGSTDGLYYVNEDNIAFFPVHGVKVNEVIVKEADLVIAGYPADGWTYNNRVFTISQDGTYTITMREPGTTTFADRVIVDSGVTATITLIDVCIDMSDNVCAFDIKNGAIIDLVLSGINVLTSGDGYAGLTVSERAVLTITSTSAGALTAVGGSGGAGIGGGLADGYGNILIYGNDVSVTAKNGGGKALDIGRGEGEGEGSVFVALMSDNLKGPHGNIGNPVMFTANPETSGIVTAILPAPFDLPIALLTGLGTGADAKTLSVITTFTEQETVTFVLQGYHNSPIEKTGTDLLSGDVSVDFENTYQLTITAGIGGSIKTGESGKYAPGAIIKVEVNTVSGYLFVQWISSFSLDNSEFDDAKSESTTFVMPATDVVIEATWSSETVSSYTVKYLTDSTMLELLKDKTVYNVVSGTTYIEYAEPISGYTVDNDVKDITVGDSVNVLVFLYSENLYEVSYVLTDGVGAPVDGGQYGVGDVVTVLSGVPSRSGYVFAGWLYNGLVYWAGDDFEMSAANVVFVAQWVTVDYKLTYNANGGVGAPVDGGQYGVGDVVTVLSGVPSRSGYVFAGWLYNSVLYKAGDSFTMPLDDVVLVAQWSAMVKSYSVLYDGNGYTGEGVPVDRRSPYVSGSVVQVQNQGDMIWEGYTFIGWSTNADDTIPTFLAGTTCTFNIFNDVTLYAIWSLTDSYTITYQLGEHGIFEDTDTTKVTYPQLVYGSPTPIPPNVISKDGWIFNGWNSKPAEFVTQDATYTAQWTPTNNIEYTIHYYLQDTTTKIANSKVVTDQTLGASVTENAPTLAGYTTVAPTQITKTLVATGNVFTFYYTANTNIEYTIHYYLQGTTTKVASDKVITGQTMGASVSENAVSVSGYSAIDPTRVTAVLNATNNVFTFYYKVVSSSGGSSGGSKTSSPASSASSTPLPSGSATISPPPNGSDGGVESLQEWSFVNLVLSITGLLLVIIVGIGVLLQQMREQTQHLQTGRVGQGDVNYGSGEIGNDDKVQLQQWYRQRSVRVWLFTAFAMGVLGVIVFLFTSDMHNDMVLVNIWSVVFIAIFIMEILALSFVFKHIKNSYVREVV